MNNLRVPLTHPRPDAEAFLRAVTTPWEPSRPRLVEYIVNSPVMRPILEMIGREWVAPGGDRRQQAAYLDNFIAFWLHLGYDFVRLEIALPFPRPNRPGGDHGRAYAETALGPVATWEDFEEYPWPDPDALDFFPYEYIDSHMPDGMGMMACHGGGVFEHLSALMGYERLCVALYEDPDLVAAVSTRVGELMERYYRRLLELDRLIAVFPGDDMGFHSATLISPEHLERYTLPWHKRFAEMTHASGRPYFLHSCGNVLGIMPVLLDRVRIDAKHSFEDAIISAADFKKRYGDRIGILGGVDVDKLTRLEECELRKYVRGVIDACAPGGRFALGSGNSIPDYVPVENYLVMLDEALR
ncbi:MAG: hypothetical protein GXP31_10095 [Kiritimatiellaeota bacterium]|nr:hypothetical protein [Kiritimatiellota bacterium]